MKQKDDYSDKDLMRMIKASQVHIFESLGVSFKVAGLKAILFLVFNLSNVIVFLATGNGWFFFLALVSIFVMNFTSFSPGRRMKEVALMSDGGRLMYCSQCERWIPSRYTYLWNDSRIRCHRCSFEIEGDEELSKTKFRFDRGKGIFSDALVAIRNPTPRIEIIEVEDED